MASVVHILNLLQVIRGFPSGFNVLEILRPFPLRYHPRARRSGPFRLRHRTVLRVQTSALVGNAAIGVDLLDQHFMEHQRRIA